MIEQSDMSNSDDKKNEKNSVETLSQDSTSSENDNVNTSLIEKILCEMKNEFNRHDENNATKTEPVKERSNSSVKKSVKKSARKSGAKSTRSMSVSDSTAAETSKSSSNKSQITELGNSSSKIKVENDVPEVTKAEKAVVKGSISDDKSTSEINRNKKSKVATNKKGIKTSCKSVSTRQRNSLEKKGLSVKNVDDIKSDSTTETPEENGKRDAANLAAPETSESMEVKLEAPPAENAKPSSVTEAVDETTEDQLELPNQTVTNSKEDLPSVEIADVNQKLIPLSDQLESVRINETEDSPNVSIVQTESVNDSVDRVDSENVKSDAVKTEVFEPNEVKPDGNGEVEEVSVPVSTEQVPEGESSKSQLPEEVSTADCNPPLESEVPENHLEKSTLPAENSSRALSSDETKTGSNDGEPVKELIVEQEKQALDENEVPDKIEEIVPAAKVRNHQEPKKVPKLVLTVKPTEELTGTGLHSSRLDSSSQDKNITFSVSIKQEVMETEDDSTHLITNPSSSNDNEEVRTRRIFRNRDQTKTESDNSVKRSSRRTSKEFTFESVLQHAIARKEKSFGSLNGGVDERVKRVSPRISKSKAFKSSPEKVPDISLTVPEEYKPVVVCESISQSTLKPSSVSVALKEEESPPIVTENLKEDIEQSDEISSKMDPNAGSVYSSNHRSSRKKKRYFRGFRYSLKSGVAKLVARSKKNKPDGPPSLKDPTEIDPTTELIKSEVTETISESSSSTVSSESNPSISSKRKYEAVEKEDGLNCIEKMRRMDVPSPSTAEVSETAAVPESTAISFGGGTAAICLCQVNERVFVSAKIVEEVKEIYCQAIDSLDSEKIGCCNTVEKDSREVVMLRPSVRVPYQPLCNVHFQRLIRHNCCPGCGLFCTQGRFVQCESFHQYHRECELLLDGKPTCPHCGQDSPKSDVILSIGEHRNPVFFPLQKPPKIVPSARICIGNSGYQFQSPADSPPPLPMVPPASLQLPNGMEITSEGLPPSLDKDKLDELLHAASESSCLDARITYRTLYQAAKNGEVDKVIAALGAGLNPNHVFREWVMGSALHGASVGGHLGIVHVLIQSGAQLDVIDRDQNTPLILAAQNCQNEVVKYLVKAGASITFKGGDGMTALHLAAKAGNLEACHYILSSPRVPPNFINLTDEGGWTPLVWAAEHCHTHVVRFLLERFADAHIRDTEQNIALHWATYSGSTNIAELLLDYGSELNSTNTHGDTPLHIAARRNHYDCVILLLARGALTSIRNNAGFSVLESCVVQPSDTYRALQLNTNLQELTARTRERTQRILTTDITRGHETNPVQCINGADDEPEPTDYVYVTENCFTSNISVVRTITSLQSCSCSDCSTPACDCGKISFRCWYDKDGRLVPDFNYTDPPMLFECNQACKCNKILCLNRVVQKGISSRFQLFRTKENKGWGVSTLKFIPKGTYVCEYIGEIISDYEADTREDDSYLFDLDNRDDETYCIDARRYGNIARFINHSCVPNLQPVRVFIGHQDLHFPRIAFFANRDIQPYEELGFDYGEKFWIIKYKSFTCTCKAKTCRYSISTIQTTLDNYNKKIQELENS